LSLFTFALAAWAWRRRRDLRGLAGVPIAAAAVIVFQALLGMWTVTLKLLPAVVMAHLLGGMLLFALLAWAALRLTVPAVGGADTVTLRRLARKVGVAVNRDLSTSVIAGLVAGAPPRLHKIRRRYNYYVWG